jgi:hypothetical protein
VLIVAIANALSRSGSTTTTLIYWAGLLLIALPIFFRLCGRDATPRERLALVCLLGLSLYGVKLARDSLLYTFPDEFVHAYNAQQIVDHHHLFHSNPILPATPNYFGLEGATSALMTLTGMSSFGAGAIVVGAARLVFVASLFFIFARLSGSARLGGIGVAIYTGSSNFLFWGAQFSYESLSLPLLAAVVMVFLEREEAPDSWRGAWLVPIVLGTLAVVFTHHLTAYALIVVFAALALAYRLMRVPRPNPWPLAVFALTVTAAWLLIKAQSTVGYLFPVLEDAFRQTVNTASGQATPRGLFEGASPEVGQTPWLARLIALSSIGLLALGTFFGLREVWRSQRERPLTLLFGLAAIVFFAALGLRFAPAAWETGNRASEFLFIGLAFIVSFAVALAVDTDPGDVRRRLAVVAGLGVVLVGGAIAGWPWDSQLARPIRIKAEGAQIESEGLGLATWAGEHLPGRFAATDSDGRLLNAPGNRFALSGQGPDIEDIIGETELRPWHLRVLRNNDIRYVVADRRDVAEDNVRGYFFTLPGRGNRELIPAEAFQKFARIPVGRVYDSGRIVVYDMGDRP